MTHAQQPNDSPAAVTRQSIGVFAIRYGIGGALLVAGVAMLAVAGGDLGLYAFAAAIGAGMALLLPPRTAASASHAERNGERRTGTEGTSTGTELGPTRNQRERHAQRQWTPG